MGCHVFRGPSSCQKRLHCMQRIGKRRTEKAEAGHSSRPDPRPTAIRHSELLRAENGPRLLESIPVPRLHSSLLSGALASLRRKTRRCQHLRRERQLCAHRAALGDRPAALPDGDRPSCGSRKGGAPLKEWGEWEQVLCLAQPTRSFPGGGLFSKT